MSSATQMQKYHLYSILFAPRGSRRMAELGMQIAQQYLSPFDLLIGLIGDAGSGKSMLIKGMFPGLELTNDDEGVNIRPLPLLSVDEESFYNAHTYHLDIKFELAFTQPHRLADQILLAISLGKRVIVEHFELIFPLLKRNGDLLIGVGEEIIVTRPTLFGPEPGDIADMVFKSIVYRRMAHSAEDLCELILKDYGITKYQHDDVRRGFILSFTEKPDIDLAEMEEKVLDLIKQNSPLSFYDDTHITIGKEVHYCTGPRNHVGFTGDIENFSLIKEIIEEPMSERYLLVGLVGRNSEQRIGDLNRIQNII